MLVCLPAVETNTSAHNNCLLLSERPWDARVTPHNDLFQSMQLLRISQVIVC